MRVLWVGDMHLGRRLPSSVQHFAEGEGVDPLLLLPEAAFSAMVDLALRKKVSAVFFAGDLVEKMEDRFYAFPILEEGVRRLVAGGVKVFAVCGNHDVDALPRLAGRLEGFRILGRGGCWESVDLKNGSKRLRVTGWSFGSKIVRENPLAEFPKEDEPEDGAWVGILHCDLDRGSSNYAPVPKKEIEALRLDACFLGHIHKPEGLGEGRFVGYLGSLQSLDAGEPGLHGPVLMELGESNELLLQRVVVAPLGFVGSELDLGDELDGLEGLEDRLDFLHEKISRNLKALAKEWNARVLGVRLTLRGRVRNLGAIREFLRERVKALELHVDVGGTKAFVEKIVDHLQPFRDLEALVQGGGPLGCLAEKLRILQEGGVEAEILIKELEKDLRSIRGLDGQDWGMERIREEALAAGWGVLDALLQEVEDGE